MLDTLLPFQSFYFNAGAIYQDLCVYFIKLEIKNIKNYKNFNFIKKRDSAARIYLYLVFFVVDDRANHIFLF